jgi:hypothetical protein
LRARFDASGVSEAFEPSAIEVATGIWSADNSLVFIKQET